MERVKTINVTLVLVFCMTTIMRRGDSLDSFNDANRKLCLLKCMGICIPIARIIGCSIYCLK